jgi:superfamily II DNA or RNA helicase
MELGEYRELCKTGQVEGLYFINPSLFHVHHVDGDIFNNSPRNLQVLPAREHLHLHRPGYTAFGLGVIHHKKIIHICPGKLESVYDVVCADPHRNFVANGVVVHNCGKGKTVLMLQEIRRRAEPTLILVSNTTLLAQWAAECQKWLGEAPTIVRGKQQAWSDLTVAMIHTVARQPPRAMLANKYGVIVFDECHHLSAPTFNRVCPLFPGTRFGLTATKRREDGLEALYLYHLGKAIYTDLTTELAPSVWFMRTGVRISSRELLALESTEGLINVPRLRSWLAAHEDRNQQILDEIANARSNSRRVLVLGHVVEHLKSLHARCADSGLCIGQVKPAHRHQIMQTCDVVFGTTALVAEGLNAPWLDTLMIITPFKAHGLFQQALGRILRTHPAKKDPAVIVFEDYYIKTAKNMVRSLRRYCRDNEIPFQTISQEG